MRLGTGVVGVFTRGPALLAQQAAALADASGGRFVLGIGASSDRIVEGWNGIPFEQPLSKVSETVDFLRAGARRRAHRDRLQARQAAAEPVPIVLAALRGQDAAARGREGRRARSPTSCRSPGVPQVAEQLDGAPEGFELLCRFFCLPGEREQVEPLARFMFASYVTVPVYANFFRWLGHGERSPRCARPGRRRTASGGRGGALGPDRGDVPLRRARRQMRERLGEFVAAGVTLPVLLPITTPDKLGDLIEALGP